VRRSSPVTAAGPRRLRTVFPLQAHGGYPRTPVIIPARRGAVKGAITDLRAALRSVAATVPVAVGKRDACRYSRPPGRACNIRIGRDTARKSVIAPPRTSTREHGRHALVYNSEQTKHARPPARPPEIPRQEDTRECAKQSPCHKLLPGGSVASLAGSGSICSGGLRPPNPRRARSKVGREAPPPRRLSPPGVSPPLRKGEPPSRLSPSLRGPNAPRRKASTTASLAASLHPTQGRRGRPLGATRGEPILMPNAGRARPGDGPPSQLARRSRSSVDRPRVQRGGSAWQHQGKPGLGRCRFLLSPILPGADEPRTSSTRYPRAVIGKPPRIPGPREGVWGGEAPQVLHPQEGRPPGETPIAA